MVARKTISPAVRKQVWARDGKACRKCGKSEKLELHHIIPVAENGSDEAENLVPLCTACHREWEHLIYPHANNISFEQWLVIPPCLALFAFFMREEMWSDAITAREARELIIQSYDMMRELDRSSAQYLEI